MKQDLKSKTENFKLIKMCHYCGMTHEKKKLLKCSYKNCKNLTCKSCLVFINDKPFCHECIIKIMQNDVSMIILKNEEILK